MFQKQVRLQEAAVAVILHEVEDLKEKRRKESKFEANWTVSHSLKCVSNSYCVPKRAATCKTHKASKSGAGQGRFLGWFWSLGDRLSGI